KARVSDDDTDASEHPALAQRPPARLLRCREVCARTGLSRTTLWRLECRGNFLRTVNSPRTPLVGWSPRSKEGARPVCPAVSTIPSEANGPRALVRLRNVSTLARSLRIGRELARTGSAIVAERVGDGIRLQPAPQSPPPSSTRMAVSALP